MTPPTEGAEAVESRIESPPEKVRPFAAVLQEHRSGGAHTELSEQLAEVVAAVVQHDKGGSMTVTLNVKPSKVPGAVEITDDIKAKVPAADKPAGFFFADDNGNLSRRDPRQPELPLRRVVVLMDALAKQLRAEKLAAPFSGDRDPVFATAARTPVSARNASRTFEKAAERAKLDGVSFHALRHTFASMLIAQGRDPVFIADQLGHADAAITLRVYAHLFRAAKEATAAADQLEAEYGDLLRDASGD